MKLGFIGVVLSLSLLTCPYFSQAQQTATAASFDGARPYKDNYKVVFQLNSGDKKAVIPTLRNMAHVLEDPRLKGKLKMELVAHGDGVRALLKKNKYEKQLKFLSDNGVILTACDNTLKANHISESELFPFISIVPSGVGELVIRQQQGWAYIHP